MGRTQPKALAPLIHFYCPAQQRRNLGGHGMVALVLPVSSAACLAVNMAKTGGVCWRGIARTGLVCTVGAQSPSPARAAIHRLLRGNPFFDRVDALGESCGLGAPVACLSTRGKSKLERIFKDRSANGIATNTHNRERSRTCSRSRRGTWKAERG
jgi:hypothetical protein